jgi:hypothetical protein
MPHCPFCHALLERADAQRCGACGRTMVGTATITAEALGRQRRTSNRALDRALFVGSGLIATLVLCLVFGAGALHLVLALAAAAGSCALVWWRLHARLLAMLAYALPQVLLWGLGVDAFHMFFMWLACLVIGMLLGIYIQQLRDAHR